jgi:NAD-dependent dihydropyrimidine dehydrogenase PreA subunit
MSGAQDPLKEYHGLHAAPPQDDHERLTWASPAARGRRIRVRHHTCNRCHPCYELCVAGSLAFIRRSNDGETHETTWTTAAKAEQIWKSLLRGAAR